MEEYDDNTLAGYFCNQQMKAEEPPSVKAEEMSPMIIDPEAKTIDPDAVINDPEAVTSTNENEVKQEMEENTFEELAMKNESEQPPFDFSDSYMREAEETTSREYEESDFDSSAKTERSKKRGRPKGAKNGTCRGKPVTHDPDDPPTRKKSDFRPRKSYVPDTNEPSGLEPGDPAASAPRKTPVSRKNSTVRRIKNVETNVALPKMKSSVHNIKLRNEQIEKLKESKTIFIQPGICTKIAPSLDTCKECYKAKKRSKRNTNQIDIDCRFYQFRKLRFNDNKDMEVVGFLDPHNDPIEVDRNIWLPQFEKRVRSLSPQNARFILIHVGEQLCDLIEKENVYYEKYKSDEKPVIWKRLIEGVIELCDLCSTTLFNYHFICSKCGLSLCIDCISESTDGKFEISCSTKNSEEHLFEDLWLTQIIVGDCMERINKAFHEACQLWDIGHDCALMKSKPTADRASINLAKNLLYELEHGTTVISRELLHKTTTVEVDYSKFVIEASVPNPNLDDDFVKYFNKFRTSSHKPEHVKPIKHCTTQGKENVLSISRSLCQAASHMLYPNIPHRWLCENKLLRLLDPMHPGNEAIFHEQWQRGQPVLISNILDHLDQKLWIPQAFSAEFGEETSDFINCMNGKLVRNREISLFWNGFENVEKRLRDNEGKSMLLKLKDWPPDSDFKKIMPSRFDDIMKNLPLNIYTNRTGDLNIVKYLPSCFIHPDLGPKGYFAYGSPFFLKEGTTNLHLDVSDAVNVMCYIGFPRDKNISIDEYIEQGFKSLLEADCDIANLNRVTQDGEIPGAIWHIFNAVDADRIRDFLHKIAQERGFEVAESHDVIHDQNWYLDGELRARLFKEYNVKGYAIAQCLGDCIILPAGTPHQVRNIYSCIKIAEDFVSPQQVAHCLSLSNQFRKLTKTHTNNEEKLNIKNVAYHSVKEALATLQHYMYKRKQPEQTRSKNQSTGQTAN